MGLILDTSILIAEERGTFDMSGFLAAFLKVEVLIAAITAAELLHGVERAKDPDRRIRRQRHVEMVLANLAVQPFDLHHARCHARIWAQLEAVGSMIGAHDLQIAATAVAQSHEVATLNLGEFQRVPRLRVVDATRFQRR